jgi:transcriptional regulator with XRE-family HTH domain
VLYLKAHREAAGLTQQELAHRASLSLRGLSYVETGGKSPNLLTLEALAGALGLTVADLLAPPKRNGRKRRAS